MADLRVDGATLEATLASLEHIVAELEGTEARRDEMAGLWVGRHVARAMEGFADDWDRHRRELIGDTHALIELIRAIRDTFAEVEAALAGSLTVHGPGPVMGPPAGAR